jgi:hypothetical protein
MIKTDREKVQLILNWCIHQFKKSKYNKQYPKLRIYKSKGSSLFIKFYLKGYYCTETNTIAIFLGSIKSLRKLCNVVLHEYKHYLMDSNEYDIIYEKYRQTYSKEHDKIVEIHPHEIKCIKFAKKWEDACLNEIKQLTKINN